MSCQLIPKRISAERRSPRLLLQQTEGAMSSSSKPAYPATCQQGLVCGLLVGNDSAKVMFFHENTKKSPVADYF